MKNNSNLLYRVEQIRKLEKIAIEEYGISVDVLMECAGKRAFGVLKKLMPRAKNITVVCGKGNNGGDGYVLALLAKIAKFNVKILQLAPYQDLKGAAQRAAFKCQKLKIETKLFTAKELGDSDVIVDAIFGIGLKSAVRAKFRAAICAINKSKIPVLALDVPSGIDADTGNVLGVAIKAQATITFIGYKTGLFTGMARDYCGKIISSDLSLPAKIFHRVKFFVQILNLQDEIKLLPPRKLVTHKGDFGHVLVVGGDYGMGGAVRLAAEGALRVGAGLVTVATRPEHALVVNAVRPEIMAHGIEVGEQLLPLINKATVVIIGPGLGQAAWGKSLFDFVMTKRKPIVIDADALNILSSQQRQQYDKITHKNLILTPHPGEAARLLKTTSKKIQADRLSAVKKIQEKFGAVVVLKGAGTLIAARGEAIRICLAGNSGMASGGMGDVLSGMIAGFIGQGLSLFNAAKLGVLLHASAGDVVAKRNGGVGMLALDLLPEIRKILKNRC